MVTLLRLHFLNYVVEFPRRQTQFYCHDLVARDSFVIMRILRESETDSEVAEVLYFASYNYSTLKL